MSIWNDHKPAGGSGDFLKLKNGDKKKVRFVSEPAVVTYDGVKLRYQVALYNKTDKLAQIYEFGPQIFGQIGDLYEDWGEPDSFDMNISRTGSTQFDTNYSVNPTPKSEPLTKDEKDAVGLIKFPTAKARLLSAYEEDHIMPDTIEVKNKQDQYVTSEADLKSLEDSNEPIPVEDIPF